MLPQNVSFSINVGMISPFLGTECTPPIAPRKKASKDYIVSFTEAKTQLRVTKDQTSSPNSVKSQISVFEKCSFQLVQGETYRSLFLMNIPGNSDIDGLRTTL